MIEEGEEQRDRNRVRVCDALMEWRRERERRRRRLGFAIFGCSYGERRRVGAECGGFRSGLKMEDEGFGRVTKRVGSNQNPQPLYGSTLPNTRKRLNPSCYN